MSWFGDSLNSLKGQITKITKEVLADDENENGEPKSPNAKLKEFEALCASKDLEIENLRQENVKVSERFQEEIKFLREENRRLKAGIKTGDDGNFILSDDQIRKNCEIENQLKQLQMERDHLEELQKDHESNICFVAQQRDTYKQELEQIKGAHSDLKIKYEELLKTKDNEKGGKYLSDVNLNENQIKKDELINMKGMIQKLQDQVNSYQFEKEDIYKVIEGHEFNCENLKEKLKKLKEEVKILGEDKARVESENEELKHKINSITSDLNDKVDNMKAEENMKNELEKKLKEVTQVLDAVKIEQKNSEMKIEEQVTKLASIFFADDLDKYSSGITLDSLVNEIENFWKNILAEKENNDEAYAEKLCTLEYDIKQLQNINCELERDLKAEIDKKNELESNYKKEINLLKSGCLIMKSEEEECLIKSETDDIKKLNQELSKLMEVVDLKNNELTDCYKLISSLTQELNAIRTGSVSKEELCNSIARAEECEKRVIKLKKVLESKENDMQAIIYSQAICQEKCKTLENEKIALLKKNAALKDELDESIKRINDMENEIESLRKIGDKFPALKRELEDAVTSRSEMEKLCAEMQKTKLSCDKEWENLKAQLILKDSKITEQNLRIQELAQEINRAKESVLKLHVVDDDLNKCKNIMLEMELQRQNLLEHQGLIEKECSDLKYQFSNIQEREREIERLKCENTKLKELCKKLQNEVQNKTSDVPKFENENNGSAEIISSLQSENYSLISHLQEQAIFLTTITNENTELKHEFQLAYLNINQFCMDLEKLKQDEEAAANIQENASASNRQGTKETPQQYQQMSNSSTDLAKDGANIALGPKIEKLKLLLKRQIDDYIVLREQFDILMDIERRSKKELERLRLHIVESQTDYAETLDDYKMRLFMAEEQLKKNTSLYTSNKIRDNQHLESLQAQIKLMTAQRSSLQDDLSIAQDEIQKHKAALVSLQVVLEQFQQDKERECLSIAEKYKTQLLEAEKRCTALMLEKESINAQLLEAKNGLKAASRLGEQLDKKNEYIVAVERKLEKLETEVGDLKKTASLVFQSDVDKVDKSLLKNLLVGYISSQKADRKEQVLRIMMSVLDFDEEERNRIGFDNTQSGWLSSLLHPKGDGETCSQSLSEAFIRFLESESRPQPQLRLLPDHASAVDESKTQAPTRKPSLLLEELVLPTFNSPETSESTILKDVLNNA